MISYLCHPSSTVSQVNQLVFCFARYYHILILPDWLIRDKLIQMKFMRVCSNDALNP